MKRVNILIAGGSGHWSELNHYPAILRLKEEGVDVSVRVICDPVNPYTANPTQFNSGRKNLTAILKADNPVWVDPSGIAEVAFIKQLDELCDEHKINAIIIATDPTTHYLYTTWAVEKGMNVLCDKPLIVSQDASWKPAQAKKIDVQFNALLASVRRQQKANPSYIFCTPLRWRALTPFVKAAEGLKEMHSKTGQGITHIAVMNNGGLHRYPIEYMNGGAHGYLDGVGALSHSCYHYIDVIAWYLQAAPGNVTTIGVTLPYVNRVRDYIANQGYKKLLELNHEDPKVVENVQLPPSVMNAELDMTLHINLYDKHNRRVGLATFTSNHTTFTPRTTKYHPKLLDHANEKDGGRMSQNYFDVHQGAIQNWWITKNDVIFQGNTIESTQRLHPTLGKDFEKIQYLDAYEEHQTVTPKDLALAFIKATAGLKVPKKYQEHLQLIHTQVLTQHIFSAAYELIAEQFVNPASTKEITFPIT